MRYILFMMFMFLSCSSKKEEVKPINSVVKISKVVPKKVEEEVVTPKVYLETPALAAGIRKIMNGNWFYCGNKLTSKEEFTLSNAIAYSLLKEMDSLALDVNPWGILGTMFNESRIDVCALGLYPRFWAYDHGLLKRRTTSISHTKEEVLKVVRSKEANAEFQAFDLGLCQVLTKFYPSTPTNEFLDLASGVRICVLEMKARAKRNNTNKPWKYWPGYAADWYADKVRVRARKMGASTKDLREI